MITTSPLLKCCRIASERRWRSKLAFSAQNVLKFLGLDSARTRRVVKANLFVKSLLSLILVPKLFMFRTKATTTVTPVPWHL